MEDKEEARILVASRDGLVAIRVIGRATFKVSTEFRAFLEKALAAEAKVIILDLSACTSMDSTFMGVMAMAAIRSKGKVDLVVVNATDAHRNLLDGIGVSMVWRYAEEPVPDVSWETLCRAAVGSAGEGDRALGETILEAHRTLMDLKPENVPKFRNVVEMVSKELA